MDMTLVGEVSPTGAFSVVGLRVRFSAALRRK
jgi:hypothetical protein